MAYVYEITGSMRNIPVDTELIFPNIQTCIALTGVAGGNLVGAHATLADRTRMLRIGRAMQKRATGLSHIFVVGPAVGYNLGPLIDVARVHVLVTEAYIDVRAVATPGRPQFYKRPMNGDVWEAMDSKLFS